jgi:hypothetical protein
MAKVLKARIYENARRHGGYVRDKTLQISKMKRLRCNLRGKNDEGDESRLDEQTSCSLMRRRVRLSWVGV